MIDQVLDANVPDGVDNVFYAENFSAEEIVSTLLSDQFTDLSQLLIPDPRRKNGNPINYKMPLVGRDGQLMKDRVNADYVVPYLETIRNQIDRTRITHGYCWETRLGNIHFVNWYNIIRAGQRLRISKASHSLARKIADGLYGNDKSAEIFDRNLLDELSGFGLQWSESAKKEDRIRALSLANRYGLLSKFTDNLHLHEKAIFDDIMETLGQGKVMPSAFSSEIQDEFFGHMEEMAEYRKCVIEFASAMDDARGLLSTEYNIRTKRHRSLDFEKYENILESDTEFQMYYDIVQSSRNRMSELIADESVPFKGAVVGNLQRMLIDSIEKSFLNLGLNEMLQTYRKNPDTISVVYELDPKDDARAVMLISHPKINTDASIEDVIALCDCEDAQYRGKIGLKLQDGNFVDAYRECYHGALAKSLAVHEGGEQILPRPTSKALLLVNRLSTATYHRKKPVKFEDISESSRLTTTEMDAYIGSAIRKFGFDDIFQFDEDIIDADLLEKYQFQLEQIPTTTLIILSRIQEANDFIGKISQQQKKWDDRMQFIDKYFGGSDEIPRTFILKTQNQLETKLFQPYVTSEEDPSIRLIKKKWIKNNWPKYIANLEDQKGVALQAIDFLESKLEKIKEDEYYSKFLFDF